VTSTENPARVVATQVVNLKPFFVYLLLVVLSVVMAAGFYFIWRQLLLRDHQLREFQQQSESAERSQDKLLQQNKASQDALQTLLEEQLTQFDLRIEKLNTSDRSDWLLAETEYLLRMANQYAELAQDAKSAETLLANADLVMKELEKSIAISKAVVGIRSKIAEERAVLKLRSEFDKESLYLQLEALIKQVDHMAVVDISSMSKKNSVAGEAVASPEPAISSRVMASLLRALEKAGGYIRIQNQAQDEQNRGPLLFPDEQQYLKQNLRMCLEQAQIALLQRNQLVYEINLNNAKDWIKKYYVIDPALKNKWLTELDSASKKNIEEPLPDISASLVALKSFMLTRHVLHENPSQH
jgi:uroporphyrin-III C-methyltransferase